MLIIQGGVCAPQGYKAAGLRAGIKAGADKKDMALIYSKTPAVCAGTFTKNIVKAAPVYWDRDITRGEGIAQAIVINSGIANACTGSQGLMNCRSEAEAAGECLGVEPGRVLVASTGVIGPQLPMDVIREGIKALSPALERSRKAADDAACAIMTTDTRKKEIAVEFTVGGVSARIGGMAKGAGMIHPNMGTMLAFITSDVAIERSLLSDTVREIVEDSFNMVSVDGDISTNDSCLVLCNGLADNPLISSREDPDYAVFREALCHVMVHLAKEIAADGEGCSRLLEVTCVDAASREDARLLSKSVVCSTLTKAAVFGKDANWGRILCAMGYSGASFDPEKVDIDIESSEGKTRLVSEGTATDYSEEYATQILSGNPVKVTLYTKAGSHSATAWGCDLTYEYVTINADYRS